MPPQLDQNSTKELNLTVLQRMDRQVEDILTTAAFVTFYHFDVDASQWVGLLEVGAVNSWWKLI